MTPLQQAHAYAAHGWAVFPLRGKLPLIAGGRGFKDATRDPATITDWWTRWPDANIGVATGRVSGISVLDVDTDKGGTRTLTAIERERGVLPPGLTSITGNDGLHLIYRYAHGLRSGANVWGPGLDCRSDGGYIVVPPSRHPDTGHRYQWSGDGIFTHPLTAWPARWLPIPRHDEQPPTITPRVATPASGGGTLAGLVRYVTDAVVGQRNEHLNWAAYRAGEHIAKGHLDEREAAEALYAAAIAVGLTQREAIATIASGLRSGIGRVAS